MSGPGSPLVLGDWLALREPVDAAARSTGLADRAVAHLADRYGTRWTGGGDRPVVRDLGTGTGSMPRWLAPRLPGPVHWVLQDTDPAVLDRVRVPGARTVRSAIGDLTAGDLAGTALATASAVLDVLTAADLDALVAACAGAGCPALLTLTVTGRVALDPPDPLDDAVAAAFDDHQRRSSRLGPDAVARAVAGFGTHGTVVTAASPWRLGPAHPELTAEWLRGRVAAAAEQDPALAGAAPEHLDHRSRSLAAGRLTAEVGHTDLLFLPGDRS